MSDETYATRTLQRVQEYAARCHQSVDSDDARDRLNNLSYLYSWLADAVAAQSREFRHYVAAAMDAENQRDEALRTVGDLREEIADLKDQLDALAEALS